MRRLISKNSCVLTALLLGCFTISSQVFPDRVWHRASDEEAKAWRNDKAEAFREYLVDSTKITGLMIVHKGKVVFEYGDLEELSYVASCRKSVLSMIYGKYVKDGTIRLNKTIKELGIDDVEGILPIEETATVQDIISARSGVYHPEGYAGGMQEYAPERGSVKPGSYWLYSNWDFNVAGFIFEQETGKNIYDEVEKQLANTLHMQDWNRSIQKKEGNTKISKYLAYPMWFSTRDMARLGLLMLNKGKWKENAITHGLEVGKKGKKMLEIRFKKEGNHHICEIEDNGIGRKASMASKSIKKEKSMGVEIAIKRLELCSRNEPIANAVETVDKYDANGKPSGTKVIIRIKKI
ncbi:serine hydrolase [Muricauda sp. JGD-17]|uniref:Serine hydrolase n=1 Tax=Flagellimonas ochracea TaxID=2696472 RepID=A0A964WY85_9FLAO|nr:serine hydrolase [Allomuricauda ochracea]NAY92647.1 serine hydrolase [Allomuricauda ochracea]